MTDPTPATPDEERGTDPGFCPECDKHWSNHPDQHLPTPATPDEAVAALRGDLYLRLLDYYGSPGHAMDIADQVTAALGPGWSLSRQQGDTVAARVEEAMVGRVAEALCEADGFPWPGQRDHWRDEARRLLGVGDRDGGGDG